MRVGFVRNVGLSAVALLALGLAGCDDNPLEFEDGVAVMITTNPSTMVVPAGLAQRLESRTIDQGSRPTWDDITASVDATCGAGAISIIVPTDHEPEITPPGVFQVIAGNTLGTTCVALNGAGLTESVGVTVVGDSMEISNIPAGLIVFETTSLVATLRADDGTPVGPFDQTTDLVWSSDAPLIAAVDQTGAVTTGPLGGGAIISATWSNLGVVITATALIDVDIPEPVLTSADVTNAVGGALVTITGTGFIGSGLGTFGNPPIDAHVIFADGVPLAAGSLPAIVDATTATFLMPLGLAGDVDFTIGSVCCGESNAVTVTRDDIVAPVLVSTDIGNGDAGDVVTITATGIFTGNALAPAHQIYVDGVVVTDALLAPTIVSATSATVGLPPGAIGDVDIQMGDAAVGLSNALVVTRDTDDFEPANDSQAAGGTLVAFPVSVVNWMDGAAGDIDDYWAFTLGAGATINVSLSWVGSSGDLDLLMLDRPATAFQCGFAFATGAVPEVGTCALAAGDYSAWINDFAEAPGLTQYTLTLTP